jgi:hypothetical protein
MGRHIVVVKLICLLGHFECDGHTVHKLSQLRLTADWLAPRESDCSKICSKVSSGWLPSYIKATRPVLEFFKMAGRFPDSLCRYGTVCCAVYVQQVWWDSIGGYWEKTWCTVVVFRRCVVRYCRKQKPDFLILKIKALHCLEILGTTCSVTQCHYLLSDMMSLLLAQWHNVTTFSVTGCHYYLLSDIMSLLAQWHDVTTTYSVT